jgi:hypothetical protein
MNRNIIFAETEALSARRHAPHALRPGVTLG